MPTVVRIEQSPDVPFPLGRHVEHDDASRSYLAATAARVTGSVFHKHRGASTNQRNLGACVGFTGADYLMSAPLVRKTDHFVDADGVRFYELATQLDNVPGSYPPDDTGSSGLGLGKALKQLGLITSYDHCFGIDHVRGALQLRPVAVGLHWYRSMFTPTSEGIISSIGGSLDGGHEFTILGYDETRDLWACLNHWAPWGVRIAEAGIHSSGFWLTTPVLTRLLNEQGDAMTFTR